MLLGWVQTAFSKQDRARWQKCTGFHTISVHVWDFLTIPALKGRGGGAIRPRVYRDHVYIQLL